MSVSERLEMIQSAIQASCEKAGRRLEEVKIIAVTKYVSAETTKEAIAVGIRHIGENRVEGLQTKQEACPDADVQWHFIGTLQTRKVKDVIDKIDYLHSLDRISLAKEINKRASNIIHCFVQVNVSGEETKHGLSPEQVIPFIEQLENYPKIQVVGLMTMAPYIEDEEELRRVFRQLRELKGQIQALKLEHAPCRELSMGMSNDYTMAIEEGASFVRIGTALVGKEV